MVVDQTRVKTRSDSTHSVIVGIESSVAYCGMCILRTPQSIALCGACYGTLRTVNSVNTELQFIAYTKGQNLMFTPCVTGGNKPLHDLVNSMFVMYSSVICHPSAQRTCENNVQAR